MKKFFQSVFFRYYLCYVIGSLRGDIENFWVHDATWQIVVTGIALALFFLVIIWPTPKLESNGHL